MQVAQVFMASILDRLATQEHREVYPRCVQKPLLWQRLAKPCIGTNRDFGPLALA